MGAKERKLIEDGYLTAVDLGPYIQNPNPISTHLQNKHSHTCAQATILDMCSAAPSWGSAPAAAYRYVLKIFFGHVSFTGASPFDRKGNRTQLRVIFCRLNYLVLYVMFLGNKAWHPTIAPSKTVKLQLQQKRWPNKSFLLFTGRIFLFDCGLCLFCQCVVAHVFA